ncbi:WbqC family protein [Paenibacillus sp. FSL H7-0331]|uniref:WbqC family protein n=1 Tax=Paenibacillus sp. FSL H7-0331 TaxID=1920421 RepID=UPI00096D9F56|nr:WbqC family protein [Paenibacillus sp. FSL H7-0331]OMF13095.1 hypothetical protein BK127_21105 [Paenibacillus sp. FSL H7-0331]
MIITAHQPAYLPWLGYFDKIKRSDVYVYMDNVQYEVRSFINRNKIKTSNGSLWVTIPVKSKGHRDLPLNQIQVSDEVDWRKDHLKTIYLNYKRAPRFEEKYEILERLYSQEYIFLTDLCMEHTKFWFKQLGITTPIYRLADLPIDSKKSDLILDICRYFKADQYISGALGIDYLDEAQFKNAGIIIEYQDYKHPVYPQLWGEFVSHLTILDFWMNSDQYGLIWG